MSSEQLNTRHYLAKAFAKSFIDSVLPVPAGPEGAPPKFSFIAHIKVIKHFSIKGLSTSLSLFPKYS